MFLIFFLIMIFINPAGDRYNVILIPCESPYILY